MRKIRLGIAVSAGFLLCVCLAFPLNGEAGNVQDGIHSLSKAGSGQDAMKIVEDTVSGCKSYDDYEKFVSEVKNLIQNPDAKNIDVLYYAAGRARLEQLTFLSKDNSIESGRLYMSVNDGYRSEALESLDKALINTKLKDLVLDAILLKFLTAREGFHAQAADALLDELANKIASYSDDRNLNKDRLSKITYKLDQIGFPDYAIKLKSIYVGKLDPKGAEDILEDMKLDADRSFDEGNMKKAARGYDYYISEAQRHLTKDAMAAKVMEIAEKYFAAKRFREARKRYEAYAAAYPDSKVLDYCNYKIAFSYYGENDYIKAISTLEDFIKNHKDSVWFDRAFEMLCRLYYTNLSRESAAANLQKLIDGYYRKNIGDYAYLLIGLLHYGNKDYNAALQNFRKIDADSVYSHAADTFIADIKNIEDGGFPAFTFGSKDNYKTWEPHTAIIAKLVSVAPGIEAGETKSGEPQVTVGPRAKVKFTLDGLADVDRFAEYVQDQEDLSRLPRKLSEGIEKDILYLQWTCDGGRFADERQGAEKAWEAPDQPGQYKVSVLVDDLGLVRSPDKGVKKDPMKELSMVIIVEKK